MVRMPGAMSSEAAGWCVGQVGEQWSLQGGTENRCQVKNLSNLVGLALLGRTASTAQSSSFIRATSLG